MAGKELKRKKTGFLLHCDNLVTNMRNMLRKILKLYVYGHHEMNLMVNDMLIKNV